MGKQKYLRVTMPDESQWDVPAVKIADSRAKYYAKSHEEFQEEHQIAMNDNDELMDWASNNMNWSDISEFAKPVPRTEKEVNFEEGWVNGDKNIVEY